MNTNNPVGRRKEEALNAAIEEVQISIQDLQSDLPNINDQKLQPAAILLVKTAERFFVTHRPEPRPTIADDLAGLVTALISFRVPARDPDLGRTATYDRLRKSKGLLLAALTDALEAAEALGVSPRREPFHKEISSELSGTEIDRLLPCLAQRLSKIERSLQELDHAETFPTTFAQQRGLLNFYVGSMRVEADIAKLHLYVGDASVNFDGLARAVEVMAELTRDFVETARAWSSQLANEIIHIALGMPNQVRRLASGMKAMVLWTIRGQKGRQLGQNAQSETLERTIRTLDEAADLTNAADDTSAPKINIAASEEVTRFLPFLRRYARALCGSQSLGDRYVSETLKAIIRDPSLIRTASTPQIALYRMLNATYDSALIELPKKADQLPPEQRIAALSIAARKAFLLVALEGFSEEDGAEVLGIEVGQLQALVRQAGQELAKELATDVLIIEPEQFIALDVAALVESLGHRVAGVARTRQEAISIAKETNPGLIIAEIKLGDGMTGLDAVNAILASAEVPAIFLTAYPEIFLTGNRPEPTFLIAKPFQLAVLSAVITQALFFGRKARPSESKRR